ncbi:MAG TPA: hypothetical protein VFB00_05215 [Terriglobales bacterium]|nr:hypothetical protein [Terriglobales bacterium]
MRLPRSGVPFWLVLCAGLLAFCVQSGELGSADTMHRLQTAHSFWTSEPPVFPNEYPEFGVHGRGGKLYDWYGIGQPLLLLPADILGTYIAKLPIFADYDGSDPTVRDIIVSYTTNILLSVLTALVCFRFLRRLEFDEAQSTAGVLALLFCTTHLHYTQNMMENNYIFLLTMTGLAFQYEWLQSGSRRALMIGAAAFGLNLLTRLTTALDLMAGGLFLLLALWFEEAEWREFRERGIIYLRNAIPVYLLFVFLDRLYQFYRFGTWTDTYVRYFTLEHRLQDPTLPANYPWETPFHVGFFGPLISPEKSILLFDPLIVLTLIVGVLLCWRVPSLRNSVARRVSPGFAPRTSESPPYGAGAHVLRTHGVMREPGLALYASRTDRQAVQGRVIGSSVTGSDNESPEFGSDSSHQNALAVPAAVKAYLLSALLLVLAYICFYARYTVWSGNFAWGDRYVSTAVEMAAFVSVPLLLKFRDRLGRPVWALAMFLVGLSLAVQLASLAFWLPLEIYQADDFGHPQFVVWLRLKNIVAFALGKMDSWGLNTDAMTYDQWDYQHITTWNFLPFVLRRMGAAPRWVVVSAFGVWYASIAALFWSLGAVRRIYRASSASR